METADRFVGAFLGVAVGDAMGAPVAFMSPEQIRIKHGAAMEMRGGGWLGLRPGETTDETALAIRLARSLVDKRGFDRDDAARRYVEWLRTEPRDIDNVTRAALALIEEGIAVDEASARALEVTGEDGASNGALVRGVPLALAFFQEPAHLVRVTLDEARITHRDPAAGAVGSVANLFLARLLRGVPGLDLLFDETLAAVVEMAIEGVPSGADARLLREADLRSTGRASDTLEVALHGLYHGESFEDCLVRTVRRGGHADRTGALAGALAGAFHGPGAIPDRWLRLLQDRLVVEQTARQLHALARSREGSA